MTEHPWRKRASLALSISAGIACLATLLFLFLFRESATDTTDSEMLARSEFSSATKDDTARLTPVPPPQARPAEDSRTEEPVTRESLDAWLNSIGAHTHFQKRLAIGERLIRYRRSEDDPEIERLLEPRQQSSGLLSYVFLHEVFELRRKVFDTADSAATDSAIRQRVIRELSVPPRNRSAFRLTTTGSQHRYGSDRLVRVWTRDKRYPRREVEAAEENLMHILQVTGAALPHGVDVVATPQREFNLFPYLADSYRKNFPFFLTAAGIYDPRGKYCAVRGTLDPEFRLEVLKHELIHALCRQHEKGFITSRLVSEGLAEYLRHVDSDDPGLSVDLKLLGDSFRVLLERLEIEEKRGGDLEALEPRELLELKPREFYALSHLGYDIALATLAYIGSTPIEEAFHSHSDAPIVMAIEAIDWETFLRFLEANADWESTREPLRVIDSVPDAHAVRGGRLRRPAFVERYWSFLGARLDDSARVENVMSEIEGQENIVIALDPSLDYDRQVSTDTTSDWTLGEIVEEIVAKLADETNGKRRLLMGKRPRRIAGLPGRRPAGAETETDTDTDTTKTVAYTAIETFRWLRAETKTGQRAVFFVGSRDEKARQTILAERAHEAGETIASDTDKVERASLLGFYRRIYRARPFLLESALIIDLDPEKSDARMLAHALASVLGYDASVAYWSPGLESEE